MLSAVLELSAPQQGPDILVCVDSVESQMYITTGVLEQVGVLDIVMKEQKETTVWL